MVVRTAAPSCAALRQKELEYENQSHHHRRSAVLLAAAAVASAGAAGAVPTTGTASDVVKALKDQGYDVQFNEPTTMSLSRCIVTGVHGLTVTMTSDGNLMMMMQTGRNDTVYVDLSCPGSNT